MKDFNVYYNSVKNNQVDKTKFTDYYNRRLALTKGYVDFLGGVTGQPSPYGTDPDSDFGPRAEKYNKFHAGLDYSGSFNAVASVSGNKYFGKGSVSGNNVNITAGFYFGKTFVDLGFTVENWHMADIKDVDWVKQKKGFINASTPLGLTGDTGFSFGAHLHQQIKSREFDNPMLTYFNGGAPKSVVDVKFVKNEGYNVFDSDLNEWLSDEDEIRDYLHPMNKNYIIRKTDNSNYYYWDPFKIFE